jgi:hypothetical protein
MSAPAASAPAPSPAFAEALEAHPHARLVLGAALVWLVWQVWRRGYDWIAACGWALIAFVVASSWLLGWYVLWPLPFAAIANDRRLKVASLALVAYFVACRWPILVLGEG